MFDVIKDLNAELVMMDTELSTKGNDFYMNLCTNVEVAKSGKKDDFRTFIFNSVNPKMRGYLTNGSINMETKLIASYFILFNGVLEFLHKKEFGLDDKDLSLISHNLNSEDNTISEHLLKKYKDEKVEVVKEVKPAIEFALSAYTNYKAARAEGVVSAKHIDSLKMLMGKEFMDNVEGDESTNKSEATTNKGGVAGVGGCYIATCVYGSYDCPEVWSLRRYRDYYLKEHLFGRLFIKVYYATSPSLVKLFGKTKWFNKMFRPYLDKKVNKLIKKGYSTLPYQD